MPIPSPVEGGVLVDHRDAVAPRLGDRGGTTTGVELPSSLQGLPEEKRGHRHWHDEQVEHHA